MVTIETRVINFLQTQETEAEEKLKKVQELAKAEQTALLAKEKAAQIEKMAEANLHVRSA